MFVLIQKQRGEGCDYTIGCGTRVEVLEAQTLSEAQIEAATVLSESIEATARDDDYEQALDSAWLAEVRHMFNPFDMVNEERAKFKAVTDEQQEARERAEYERLRRRFEGTR